MPMLWDDVPLTQKGVRRGKTWRGCPFAVPLESWERGSVAGPGYLYGRCGGVPRGAGLACSSHEPRPAGVDDLVFRRVYWVIRRSHLTLAQFRAMTDADIDAMHNVGVKMSACLREIRDTWSDARALEDLDFRKAPPPTPAPDPAEFWKQRHDIFQIVGG